MLLTKNNIKEFTAAVRKSYPAKLPPLPVNPKGMLLEEPPAVQYNRELIAKRKADAERIKKLRPGMKDIIQFAQENKLIFNNLNPYHFRIKNPRTGKFVDWWDGKKQTMRRMNGSFGYQGGNKAFLLQELAKLA